MKTNRITVATRPVPRKRVVRARTVPALSNPLAAEPTNTVPVTVTLQVPPENVEQVRAQFEAVGAEVKTP